MITIRANTTEQVVLNRIESYPYYLFVFKLRGSCEEVKEVYSAETDCTNPLVTIVTDLDFGQYDVDVYGQTDYSNTDTTLAEYQKTYKIRVYNPIEFCYPNPYLLDENGYILTDSDGTKLKYR